MSADAGIFDAWCAPGWSGPAASAGPGPAVRILPPARTRSDEPPDLALAVPELDSARASALVGSLRSARPEILARPALDIARALGGVGRRFLDDGDPLRRKALEVLPATTGLSPAMCREVLDGMARDWTAERLEALLRAEFPDPGVLDGFVASPDPSDPMRRRATGAPFAFHLSAGSVPGVSTTSLIRSLLVKSPLLLKPGRGDVALPVLFLRALAGVEPELARAAAVVYWPGGDDAFGGAEDTVLDEAELVVAYGGDGVIADLRRRVAPTTRLVAYHHRVSFAVLGRTALVGGVADSAAAVGRAVALFDRRGCVSPHAVFVESPEDGASEAFADALTDAFRHLESELPSGRMDDADASAVQQLRGTLELRSAAGEDVSVRSGGRIPWTVVVEPGGGIVPSCPGRMVRVVPVRELEEVPGRVAGMGRHLQTVGHLGVEATRLEALAESLARVGVLRVVPLAQVPYPPAWWRHDGRGPLEALVRWVELDPDQT